MLTACVYIPHFPVCCELQRPQLRRQQSQRNDDARLRPDGNDGSERNCDRRTYKPIILYDSSSANPTVVDCTPDVPAAPGDSLAVARARCPNAIALKEDRDYYRQQWEQVLKRLMRVADRVEDALIGCAYVALDGLDTMYGGRENVIQAVADAVPEWLVGTQLGIARGKFHARCAAMTAEPGIPNVMPADPAAARRAVAAMPTSMLPLHSRDIELLHEFGIRTIGDLAQQPMSAIQAQIGYPGKRAWELANGIDDEPIMHREQSETITQQMQFQWPVVSIDALSYGIHAVMQSAFNAPARGDKAVGRVDILLKMEESADWSFSRTFKEPVGDASTAAQRVMDAIIGELSREPSPMQSPIVAIHIALTKLGTPRAEQSAMWAEDRTGDIHTSIRQLAARSDMPALTKVVDVEPWSRIPERRQALAPVTSL